MSVLFKILLFFIPIILYPYTSELFEFNKMIAVYILTVLIVATWLAKMILGKKIIFRRTILDIPLLIFLLSQIISTILSLDHRTSLLGYYSRFNGGLISTICYSLLYWAWVANMNAKKTLSSLFFLMASGIFVSVYGILEHLGIDKNIWVQDVQKRVFSTLGQPNWLAAWLTALIPLTWAFALKGKFNTKKFWLWSSVSLIFFATILFTKSRSGLGGLAVASLIFWAGSFVTVRKKWKSYLKKILILTIPLLLAVILIGTPWTSKLTKKSAPVPALEGGGTESGTIRQIVWKGALNIWKNYPLFGSGVETFAYSFYNFRPIEHNLVSEWDFLYNKAHNEYLNFMATTGTFGIISYLAFIGFSGLLIIKSKSEFNYALLGGYTSILVTNFFGFSVVPVSLLFYLFPAFAVALTNSEHKTDNFQLKKLAKGQKAATAILLLIVVWLLILIARYWYADTLFAKGKSLNDSGNFVNARSILVKTINLSGREPIFWDEISQSTTGIALALNEAKQSDKAQEFVTLAIQESDKAITLSPRNVNLKRNRATIFLKLATLDKKYLENAINTIMEAITLAPTDAKLYYNLGLTYFRTGDNNRAIETFEKTIAMKPNYRDARYAYALVLIEEGQKQIAKEELNYILTSIEPKDPQVRQEFENLTP